jgi:GTPase SAR1 family protein
MKFLDENFEIKVVHSIKRSFSSVQNKGPFWVIFDMPGQVELNTHVDSVKNIVLQLENTGFRLCSLHLVDSHYCSDPGKYIACLLTSLTTMLHINLPHINILSKIDLVEKYGKLPFNLDYYTDVLDLNYLVDILDNDKGTNKYKALNNSIAELVDSYSLVSFQMLDVQNDVLVEKLGKLIDRILGRVI